MTTDHTKGPLAWQKFGNRWCLTGQYGMRPIILSATPKGELMLRDAATDRLVPFYPEHPDAQLIASAPDSMAEIHSLTARIAALEKELELKTAELSSMTLVNKVLKETGAAMVAENDSWREERPRLMERESDAVMQAERDAKRADENAAECGRLNAQLTASREENAGLRKALIKSALFVDRAAGTAIGIAMSGDNHPNADQVLEQLFRDGNALSRELRAALAPADGAKKEPNE